MENTTCVNSPDGFACLCPPGLTGDGRINGSGCTGETIVVDTGIYIHTYVCSFRIVYIIVSLLHFSNVLCV